MITITIIIKDTPSGLTGIDASADAPGQDAFSENEKKASNAVMAMVETFIKGVAKKTGKGGLLVNE